MIGLREWGGAGHLVRPARLVKRRGRATIGTPLSSARLSSQAHAATPPAATLIAIVASTTRLPLQQQQQQQEHQQQRTHHHHGGGAAAIAAAAVRPLPLLLLPPPPSSSPSRPRLPPPPPMLRQQRQPPSRCLDGAGATGGEGSGITSGGGKHDCQRALSAGMGDSNPHHLYHHHTAPPSSNSSSATPTVTSCNPTCPLPKLPVPELTNTLDKYLTLLSAVVSENELDKTRQYVQDLGQPGGLGEALQNYLLQRRAITDNWVYDWWLEDMYLKIRLPLPINSNPGMVFPRQRFAGVHQQLSFAAKFVLGILDYKSMIDTGTVPVERCRSMEKNQPLCMEQHYRMLSSYRRPGDPLDQQLTTLGTAWSPHIIVACRDQFYKLELEHESVRLSESELHSQLSKVLMAADTDSFGDPPVGVLTSNNRSKWAAARARLTKDQRNADNLETIENSLFILCLDKPTVVSPRVAETDTGEIAEVSQQMLHGQGTAANTCNRWFDKTIQIVVAEDGACGMNYEHSVAEGIALVHLVEHALKYASADEGSRLSNHQQTRQIDQPLKLNWTVTPETQNDIHEASEQIDTLISDLDFHILHFKEYGREFPKSQGLSPDTYIQLALQMTYYKLHGCLTMTYESASIRRYRQGRVDNIRANSPAALAWIQAMLGQEEVTTEKKYELLKAAASWQQKYQTETVLGQGIDCHLLGLREAASALKVHGSLPFFTDPNFAKTHYFKLSTSQVPTSTDSFMCYGPVVPDGYGACYNPFHDRILVCVSSFLECADTDSVMFAFSLESTLLQMRELCLQAKQSSAL